MQYSDKRKAKTEDPIVHIRDRTILFSGQSLRLFTGGVITYFTGSACNPNCRVRLMISVITVRVPDTRTAKKED